MVSRELWPIQAMIFWGSQPMAATWVAKKGVDVSLAIDLIKLTYEKRFEAAIIVSQDWDFGPAVLMAKELAKSQGRMLGFESAYPENTSMPRGVPGTEWYRIKKAEYDTCLDPRDYRIRPVP